MKRDDVFISSVMVAEEVHMEVLNEHLQLLT